MNDRYAGPLGDVIKLYEAGILSKEEVRGILVSYFPVLGTIAAAKG